MIIWNEKVTHPDFLHHLDNVIQSAHQRSIPIYAIDEAGFENWCDQLDSKDRAWYSTNRFCGKLGQYLLIPAVDGSVKMVVAGYGNESMRKRGRFHLAHLARALPCGQYHFENLDAKTLEHETLGWLFAGYVFDRYKNHTHPVAQLLMDSSLDQQRLLEIARGEFLTRDLINTPANDMGPDDLEHRARALAQLHGANFHIILDDDLLKKNLPLIHAVGRASDQKPRLIDIRWGETGPKLTLVGKGVCFDTGGLNLKPGSSMGLMKKDMGGAATVLGLAHMIMGLGLDVQLRVLIPAVENSVAGNAMRPGDVLTSRKGLTIEINNTDAEGRLVLADALALGAEDSPDLMISMATLTGAARVAVGPDLSPYYTDIPKFVAALESSAERVADPVWHMPFYSPYERMIEPAIADLDNAPKGGFAGSITAALFLRRFAGDMPYMHFDIYGWNPDATAALPKGGVGMGARAIFDALPAFLELSA